MRYLFSYILLLVIFTGMPCVTHAEEDVSILKLGEKIDDPVILELGGRAQSGDAAAEYEMATHFISGIGVEKDPKQAITLFKRSADQAYPKAMFIMGKLYMEGIYIKKSDKKAIEWYEKAAKKGHGNAQYYLPMLLSRYKDSKEHLMKSYAWFAVVSERGHPRAASKREEIAKELDVFEIIQAKRLAAGYYENYVVRYEKSAESDDSDEEEEEEEEQNEE